MVNIAVLGFGTVGSGVVEIISECSLAKKAGEEIAVKSILDLRDFPDSPYGNLVTHDFQEILNDGEIQIVVEAMGGLKPAYEFTKQALQKGKSVVTSNKELVATHGAELLATAKENGVSYMFEASVGGGIPIIRPMISCLAANEIIEIMGILNGTTNYILTKMIHQCQSFEDALADAQQKGYAERDPSADIEGHDSCRKIAILSALAFGKQLDCSQIPTEGITKITLEDVDYAASVDSVIKLVGYSKKVGDKVWAEVSPLMLPGDHPLASVVDVFNAILVTGSATGDVMFYGKGAGKMPTASAVVADVIDIVKHGNKNTPNWTEGGKLAACSDSPVRYYIRVSGSAQRGSESVNAVFGKVQYLEGKNGETVFITSDMPQSEFDDKLSKLETLVGKECILGKIKAVRS